MVLKSFLLSLSFSLSLERRVSKWEESAYKRLVRILVETIPIQEIID